MTDVVTQLDRIRRADQGRPRRQVTILGAGMAGLAAAVELDALGHRVRIFEASSRAGGRVWTHRFGTDYGELGAMRIPTHHDYTRHYAAHLGLRLRPFITAFHNDNAFLDIRDIRTRIWDARRKLYPAYALSPEQRADPTPVDMLTRAVLDTIESLTDDERTQIVIGKLVTGRLRQLDRTSIGEFITKRLGSDAAELVSATLLLDQLLGRAATILIRDALQSGTAPPGKQGRYDEIVGGMDLLPRGLEGLVRQHIEFDAAVQGIHVKADGGVDVSISRKKTPATLVSCDVVICTLPFGILRRLDITPPFSADKMRAIRLLSYESATKVLLHCTDRFWEGPPYRIYGGASMTDHVIGAIGYPSDYASIGAPIRPAASYTSLYVGLPADESGPALGNPAPRTGVLLGAYALGQNARRLGALTRKDRRDLAVRHIARLHPEIASGGVVDDHASMFWDSYPWTGGGAFSYFGPGEQGELLQAGRQAEGNIHFAGEHCSTENAWIQGALRSALQAVEEIVSP